MLTDSKKTYRIIDVVEQHRNVLADAREDRKAAIRQFEGPRYAGRSDMDRKPLMMVQLAASGLTFVLAANRPQYLLTTRHPQMAYHAVSAELAMNDICDQQEHVSFYQELVASGMFGLGMRWMGLADPGTEDFHGMSAMPILKVVDFDDLVYDPEASRFDEAQLIGHRFYAVYDRLLENADQYDESLKRLKSRDDVRGQDERGEDYLRSDAQGNGSSAELLYPVVELWNIWDREKNLIWTVSLEQGLVLRKINYKGPARGPYDGLNLCPVLGNILPAAPIYNILDLDELANNLYNKAAIQAIRQKNLDVVENGDEDDAKKMMAANDGDAVPIKAGSSFKPYSSPGPAASNISMIGDAMDRFRYFMGNLDAVLGLDPAAETARGSAQVLGQAGARISFYRQQVNQVARHIGQDLLFWLQQDKSHNQELARPIPGINSAAVYDWRASQAPDLRRFVQVEPYSMQPVDPQQRLAGMMQIVDSILVPLAGPAMQQGVMPNVKGLIHEAARLSHLEDEEPNMVAYAPPPPPPAQGMPQQGPPPGKGSSGKPKGQYQHTYRSVRSSRGHDAQMAGQMMGQQPQQPGV